MRPTPIVLATVALSATMACAQPAPPPIPPQRRSADTVGRPPANPRGANAGAEPTSNGNLPTTPSLLDPPIKFDTSSLRLKFEGGRWQLWAGAVLLKDFGRAQNEAHEALQVFRDLRVNSRGSIGGVFEYWLADGEAPAGLTRHRQVVRFNPDGLRVQQIGGGWCLRDERIILYNFGPSRSDAEAALAVCKQYRFNQLGYVGHPTPMLKYLMSDPQGEALMSGPAPLVPASARMQAREQARRPFVLPNGGMVGTVESLDHRRLELRKDRGEWRLLADGTQVGSFGAFEREGRSVLQALQQFRCTELCRVGDSGFGFFLSNGRAPQGSLIGIPSRPMRQDGLAVRQVGGAWGVYEERRLLLDFGANRDAADKTLAALKHFQFDAVSTVGDSRLGGVMLFVKSR